MCVVSCEMHRSATRNHAPRFSLFVPAFLPSTQLIRIGLGVENGPVLDRLHPVVLQHTVVHTRVFAFDAQGRFRDYGFDNKVVIAVGAVLVSLFELLRILAETLFALFAGERHLEGL